MSESKITFDTETIKMMSMFAEMTRVQLKDCFDDRGKLVFLVEPGELGKALGKNKQNVMKLEKLLNRKVKIVEYSTDRLTFIKNYITPLKIEGISEEGDIVTIVGTDTKTKGLLIGIKAQNLRNLEKIVGKYFTIQEIKVV
jgi:transcription termination/antitermination protein NusA